MSLRIVFIMDPMDRIAVNGDSTFALMLEAQARGHRIEYATPDSLELDGAQPLITAQSAEVRRVAGDHYTLSPAERIDLNEVDAVFMRKDPPIDWEYIVSTYVLDFIDRSRVSLVNDPQALRDCNEKLFASRFPHLMPRTIVARSTARLRAFIDEVGDVVVKPLFGAGGAGVVRLTKGDKNTGSILDMLTGEGHRAITAQAYLPAVTDGDRRVILIGGAAIGVINRRPADDDLRSNMHVGGKAEPAKLSARDREICEAIGPELVRRGLPFVGIDVIGGNLTEINVTSPTGFQELDRFDGGNSAGLLIDWVENDVINKRTAAGRQ